VGLHGVVLRRVELGISPGRGEAFYGTWLRKKATVRNVYWDGKKRGRTMFQEKRGE